jgi:hypothetical protein
MSSSNWTASFSLNFAEMSYTAYNTIESIAPGAVAAGSYTIKLFDDIGYYFQFDIGLSYQSNLGPLVAGEHPAKIVSIGVSSSFGPHSGTILPLANLPIGTAYPNDVSVALINSGGIAAGTYDFVFTCVNNVIRGTINGTSAHVTSAMFGGDTSILGELTSKETDSMTHSVTAAFYATGISEVSFISTAIRFWQDYVKTTESV